MLYTVQVYRDEMIESQHLAHVSIITDPNSYHNFKNSNLTTFIRSAAKPFQVVPYLKQAEKKSIKTSLEQLAIFCASHSGEEIHTNEVKKALINNNIDKSYLKCGIHSPFDEITAKELTYQHKEPNEFNNNCSGKHSAALSAAKLSNYSLNNYLDFNSDIQKDIYETLLSYTGLNYIKRGIDGCGFPVFYLPLTVMADLYYQLAIQKDQYLQHIFTAMTAHPYLVAGNGRIDTELMQASHGNILVKCGAEGILCLALKQERIGIALKILDGSTRAYGVLCHKILSDLGVMNDSIHKCLNQNKYQKILNHANVLVGHLFCESQNKLLID